MAAEEPWTIGRLLKWTTDYLTQQGADSPRLDAELLLAEALGCPRIQLYARFGEEPAEAPRARFRQLVRQRAEGAPVAYLLGRREFFSLSFRVTPEVLIPRPETELVVVQALDLLKQRPAGATPPRVADVGTGSGAIAVCLARHHPEVRVTAVDVSPAALAVARENAKAHGVAERVELLESDLLAGLPSDARFDLVVSNPPYVRSAEWAALARDVRDYEPRGALEAGPEGTEVIARLLPQAAERLRPGGYVLVEISPMLEGAVRALVASDGRYELRPTVKDLAQRARVIVARRQA